MQEIVGIAAEAPGAAVGRLQFGRLGQIGLLIQSLCQNLLDGAVLWGAEGQRPRARRLEPGSAVLIPQPDQALSGAQLLEDDAFRRQAQTLLAAFGPRLAQAPDALPQMLSATLFDLARPVQIILAGDPAADETRALLRAIHARFIPNKTLLLAAGGGVPDMLLAQRPALREMAQRDGRATAYVCRDAVCKPPATDPATLAGLLADE